MSTESCPLRTTFWLPPILTIHRIINKVTLKDMTLLLPVLPFPGKEPKAFLFEAKELLMQEKHLQNNSVG